VSSSQLAAPVLLELDTLREESHLSCVVFHDPIIAQNRTQWGKKCAVRQLSHYQFAYTN